MFLEILLFFVILKNPQSQVCQEKSMDKNEFFISNFADALLIDTDEADFSKINSIGFDVLLFEYSQHYELEGTQISATLLRSFQNKHEFQICNLINKDISYFIQCIIGFTSIKEKINLNYSNKTQVITLPNEICQSIFYDQKQNFTIFCYSEEMFQLISVNLDNQGLFYSLYNYPQNSELKLCKPISIQIKPFDYVIGYLNCQGWSIFRSLDNNFTLILDQTILNTYQNGAALKNLVNLQVCQKDNPPKQIFYALFDIGYVQIKNYKVSVFLLQTYEHKITSLIFDHLCNVIMFVGQEELLIQFQYYPQSSTLTFSKSIPPPQVHPHEQFKILQLEKTLLVFINQKFIQYYDISGLLLFDRTFNYFFAIDPSLNQIQFYKIKHLPKYLVPQCKYIYNVNLKNFNCCDEHAIKCNYIIKQDSLTLLKKHDFGNNEIYLIQKDQQSQLKFIINYLQFMDGIPIFLEVPSEYQHILSIEEMKINISSICQINSTLQDSIILFFDIALEMFVFQDQKNIYFYNCTQQKLVRHEQIQGKSVLITKNYVIIVDRILNLLNIIVIQLHSIKSYPIKIDSEITNAELSLNYIIINLKGKEPLIIEIFSDDKIVYNVLINNEDDVLFYFRNFYLFQIYQVKGYLLIQKNDNILKIKFPDWKILGVNQNLIFFVLHNIDLTLKICTINQNEVMLLSNLDLFDFSIYLPLSYSYSHSSLYIVAQRQNKLYILIYSLKGSNEKLRVIIPIGKPNFYSIDQYIHYYDENNILVQMNTQYRIINYRVLNFNKLFEITRVHLNLLSQIDFKQYNTYNLTLKILINEFQIIPKSNLSIQPATNLQHQFQIFNHFLGPINKLYLKDDCPFNLNGPLLIRKNITQCDQSLFSDCLFNWKCINSSLVTLQCVFFKMIEENNSSNTTKFILLFPMFNWYQLRNGDVFYILQNLYTISEVSIYTYDSMSDRYTQYKKLNVQFDGVNQIRQTGDLILCQANSQFFLLYVNRNFIKKIYETKTLFDIVYIEDSDEEYIILNQNNHIDIAHYNFSQGNVTQMQTYTIEKQKLLLIGMKDNDFLINQIEAQSLIFSLLNAIKVEFEIRLNGILNYRNVSFYITVTINTLNQGFEYKIIKFFRNLQTIEKAVFIDEKFGIFKSQIPFEFYIYDLRQEQEFYDPISQMNMYSDMAIQSYNSTHYIFKDQKQKQAFLIEIGYEISVIEKEKSKNCQLIAENEISKAEIQLIIQQDEINTKINNKSIIILSISVCILIVLIIFIFRRQQLKNNLRLFQPISLDQSKLQ